MSNKRHKYFNKVHPFKQEPEHYTRKQRSWKAKDAYETQDDALEYLNQKRGRTLRKVPDHVYGHFVVFRKPTEKA